ncbi:MAG: hypothetical protein IT427_18565 [Pirellulales bacterium]|nr:hypothetical protein [Pirellulales bacterium]
MMKQQPAFTVLGSKVENRPSGMAKFPPALCPLPPACRGISLMEVLISIGIVAIGLVSVLSLLPVGSYQAAQAEKEERKANLGMNAVQGLKNRGVLNMDNWRIYDSINNRWIPYAAYSTDFHPPIVIDPWMSAVAGFQNATDYQKIENFPATGSAYPGAPFFPPTPPVPLTNPPYVHHWLGMKRLTVAQALVFDSSTSKFFPSRPLADALCISADDTYANRPDDSSLPAESPYTVDASNNRLKRDYEGLYSWLITLTPIELEPDHVVAQQKRQYLMSLVIFNRRLASVPTPGSGQEEMVYARFAQYSTGLGGGDFDLAELSANGADTKLELARPGNWLMLCRYEPTGVPVGNTSEPQVWPVFNWYRIVNSSDTDDGQILVPDLTGGMVQMRGRSVTLSGPDWQTVQPGWPNDSSVAWPSQIPSQFRHYDTYACLFDNIVAVFQRPICLEGPSQWSQ